MKKVTLDERKGDFNYFLIFAGQKLQQKIENRHMTKKRDKLA